MPNLTDIRQKYPQYNDMDDETLASAFHKKFYADMPREEFDTKIGHARKPSPDIGVDVAKGASYGFNEGVDATLNMIGAPIRGAVNMGSRALGYGDVIPELQLARRANDPSLPGNEGAGPGVGLAGRTAQAIGEVAGSSALPTAGLLTAGRAMAAAPGIIAQYGTAPGRAIATDAAATLGAGSGISVARENDLGPTGEIGLGLAGGFLAPNALNVASQGLAAAKGTANYAGRMVSRARNPQMAGDQDTVDALLKSGVPPERLYNEFSPPPSTSLQGRGIDQEKMAEVISRAGRGEPVANLAKEIGVAPSTLQGYLRDFKEMSPTPRGIADAVTDIANVGGAKPVLRLGRAAFGIADDAVADQAMTARQNDQYGRMVGIVRKAAKGRDYDATISDIDEALGKKSQIAYGQAHQNAQPFDLQPTIRKYRDEAFKSAGQIREGLEKGVDLFFEPTTGPKPMTEAAKLRIVEQEERVADLISKGASDETVFRAQRRLEAMQTDADAEIIRKLGQPISDVKRYQAAREALDQMIQTSKHEMKATPLTRKLTGLRKAINAEVRKANPLLAAADDQFSGAKSTQELLKRGEELTTSLGSKQDDFFKSFKSLTAEQQEVVQLAFLRKLENSAAKPQEGAAVANKFRSNEVKQTIKRLFQPHKSLTKAQNKERMQLADTLIKEGVQEATTTGTFNFVTGRANSPTAPWKQDMDNMTQGAELVGDVATLNWRGVLMKTARKLASQIGSEQAKVILSNVTETDPHKRLEILQRLIKQAKTTKERREYVIALKEFRKVGRRPGVDAGAIVTSTQDRKNRLMQ